MIQETVKKVVLRVEAKTVLRENIRVAVCDDEKEDLVDIAAVLRKEIRQRRIVAKMRLSAYTSGERLYQDAKNRKYDLVFLDIEMPGQDGFWLARRLSQQCRQTCIVFVSKHESMVFDAMEYMPLGFVRKGRLQQDMDRILSLYFRETASRRITYKIKEGSGCREVFLKDILYVECQGHEVLFVMAKDQKCYRTYGSLKAIEEELAPHEFLRVHKNYLVNLWYVEAVEQRDILFTNGQRVDLGRDRRKAVKEAMCCYGRRHYGGKWLSG